MGMNVLVVDDSEKVGRMFKDALSDEGIETDYVLGGEEAIKRIREKKYDLVFLDVVMPGMNGVETLERIREFDPHIQVVMISGYSVVDMLERARSLVIHSFLSKPINLSQILNVIRDVSSKIPNSKSKKCLVIDKKDGVDTSLFSVLKESGFVVTIHGKDHSSEDIAACAEFDLIVMNVDVEQLEGDPFVAALKNKILLLVDNSEEVSLMEKALSEGANQYVIASNLRAELPATLKRLGLT